MTEHKSIKSTTDNQHKTTQFEHTQFEQQGIIIPTTNATAATAMPQSVITPTATPTKPTFYEAKEHTPAKVEKVDLSLATSSPKIDALADRLNQVSTSISDEGQ